MPANSLTQALLEEADLIDELLELVVEQREVVKSGAHAGMQDQMKRIRFSVEDLIREMHLQSVFRLEDIAWAIVETNGKVSLLQKPDALPATAAVVGSVPPDDGLQMMVVSDGNVIEAALNTCGLDQKWLDGVLKKEKIAARDIFIMTADKSKKYRILRKD